MLPINTFHYDRYIRFLSLLPKRDKPKAKFSGLEKHHIYPKSFGGTDDLSNLIYLTCREHYLAHWMLAKAYGGVMWFAFNQMKRVIQGDIKKSSLYSLSRKYISEQISISNTGNTMSDYAKNLKTIMFSGKVWVKNKDDYSDYMLISNTDERYLSGEYVGIQTGLLRSESSKKNMADKNGLRGKVSAYNIQTKEVSYFYESEIPLDYIKGRTPEFKNIISERYTDMKFYKNFDTGETKRIKDGSPIPYGFILHRNLDDMQNGLNKMNDPNSMLVYDVSSKISKIIPKTEFNSSKFYTSVATTANAVVFENYVFDSVDTFNKLLPDFKKISKKNATDKIKMGKLQKRKFCEKFKDMCYNDIGFFVIKITELVWNEDMIFIRKIDESLANECRRIVMCEA